MGHEYYTGMMQFFESRISRLLLTRLLTLFDRPPPLSHQQEEVKSQDKRTRAIPLTFPIRWSLKVSQQEQ